MADRRRHRFRHPGLLRVLRHAPRAVGRPGGHRHDRRPQRRVHPRPERLAPGALGRHRRRPPDDRIRDRRVGLPPRAGDFQGPPRPGRDDHRRHLHRQADGVARDRRDARGARAVQGMAAPGRTLSRDIADRSPAARRADGARGADALREDVRHHPRGTRGGAQAAVRERGGGRRLDGRRYAAAVHVATHPVPVRLFPTAVCAGHQPADRLAARAGRHVAGNADRARTQPVRAAAGVRAAHRDELAGAVAAQVPRVAGGAGSGGWLRAARPEPARERSAAGRSRRAMRRSRGGGAREQAGDRAQRSRAPPGSRAGPRTAGHRRRPPSPRARRTAVRLQPAGGNRHRARSAPVRLPDRLRRHRDLSVPGLRVPQRPGAQRPAQGRARERPPARAQLPARHPQGLVQDHVEDGHLDDRELPRRGPVRDRRAARRGRGAVLPGQRFAHPGRRLHRPEVRRHDPGPARLEYALRRGAGRAAALRAWRRVPRLQPGCHRHAAGRGAERQLRRVPGIRAARERAPRDGHPRPAHDQAARSADPARRGRAGGGAVQALRLGWHEPRRVVPGSARGARHRHEPSRRALELRRGRRGQGALRHREGLQDQAGGPRGASASRPSTSSMPRSCRSRSRRARSPARAASCPATRSTR
jgi:hypothetical protein